ncbi:MAG: hypothetical protein ACRDOU_28110 [Streptosporangiaceae bacterium]
MPQRAVLVLQEDELSQVVGACRPPRVGQREQCQEPCCLGLAGQQADDGAGETDDMSHSSPRMRASPRLAM